MTTSNKHGLYLVTPDKSLQVFDQISCGITEKVDLTKIKTFARQRGKTEVTIELLKDFKNKNGYIPKGIFLWILNEL